jgi:hypothetical protein
VGQVTRPFFVVVSVCLATTAAPSIAFASSAMPRVVHGQLLSYAVTAREGYGGVVAYDSVVSRTALAEFGPPNPASSSCAEGICFGLGTVDGFQYPLISSDGRKTWRNAGHWFAGAWADGAAFASTITTFSATTAVAWYPGQNTFYVTSDAGHRWYAAWPDGAVVAVTSPNGGSTLVMHVGPSSMTPTTMVVTYRSTDGGHQWIRTS